MECLAFRQSCALEPVGPIHNEQPIPGQRCNRTQSLPKYSLVIVQCVQTAFGFCGSAPASSAFVCADLILGGYQNPIPLDETVDAVLKVGEMLPAELRCTALGGIATAPSAMALPRLR